MTVPNQFGTATSAIPLSQLDANFNTPITLGNTAIQLGDTVTTLNNMTLANVTISSGTITITNVAVTTANVSGTANISTLVVVGNATVGGNTTITGNITATNANVTTNLVLSGGTANGVAYLNTSKVLTTGSALVFDGTNLGIGSTSPIAKLDISGISTSQNGLRLTATSGGQALAAFTADTSTGEIRIGGTVAAAGNYFPVFYAAGSERARIDSSGRLLVGDTTAPSGGLPNILSANSAGGGIQFYHKSSTGGGLIGGIGGGGLLFYTYTGAIGSETYSDRMRLDASGNLGLGVTPSAWGGTNNSKGLQVGRSGAVSYSSDDARVALSANAFGSVSNGWKFINDGGAAYYSMSDFDNNHRWFVATTTSGIKDAAITFTQAMTLDGSGNLLVGVTSGSTHIIQKSNASSTVLSIINSSATSPSGAVFNFSAAAPNNGTQTFWTASDNAAYRGGFLSNGGLQNYQSNDSNLSDRREKTNFAPAKSYLDAICSIPVQTFNYIDQNMEDDGGLTLGVVAQDVQAVAPELVMESNWATEGQEPKMRLSIYQTDLQYALMKCIQEQQALIQTLTARITALEGA